MFCFPRERMISQIFHPTLAYSVLVTGTDKTAEGHTTETPDASPKLGQSKCFPTEKETVVLSCNGILPRKRNRLLITSIVTFWI
jgi:hypothetical protein